MGKHLKIFRAVKNPYKKWEKSIETLKISALIFASSRSRKLLQPILGNHFFYLGNVLLLSIILTKSFLATPGVPLSLAFEVQHTGPLCVDISNSSLLVEGIDFFKFII